MLYAVANLGWALVLGICVVVFGICWSYRLRHTTTRERYKGTQKPSFNRLTDRSSQPEDEFEDAEDVIMVSDDDDDSEPEISPPVRRHVVQARSQQETSIPSNTVQVNRKP
jgi:hypothetical protein